MNTINTLQQLRVDYPLPTSALEVIEQNKETFIPHLLEHVEYLADNIETLETYNKIDLVAVYLLAHFKEKRAFPALIRIINSSWPYQFFQHAIIKDLHRFISGTFDGNVPSIQALIENGEAKTLCRIAGIMSLVALVANNHVPRKDIAEYFKKLLTSPAITGEMALAESLVVAGLDIHPEGYHDEILACLNNIEDDKDFVDNNKKSLDDLSKLSIEDCIKQRVHEKIRHAPLNLHQDLIWMYSQSDATPEEEIRRVVTIKIGRNDLCPCKSGKKYKKCCLKLDKPNMLEIPF